jgi:Polyketide cyclase / dehydrase and lipid transport
MTTLVEHVTTPLAREAAFAYVADFSRQAEWDPNTVSSKRIDDGDLGVGARFALDVKMGTRTTSMEYRITEYQSPSLVVLVGEGSGVWSQDRITFAEAPEGTRVDYVAEIKLSGLLGVIQPLLGRAFAGIAKGAVNGMKRELDALAASGTTGAEADASATDPAAGEG